jgi:hypothetical protein
LDRGAESALIVTGQGIELPGIGLGIKECLQRWDAAAVDQSHVDNKIGSEEMAGLISSPPSSREAIDFRARARAILPNGVTVGAFACRGSQTGTCQYS